MLKKNVNYLSLFDSSLSIVLFSSRMMLEWKARISEDLVMKYVG